VHQAYKATNPPIVVDLTPEVVNVHGVEPNPRNHRLEAIKQLLEVTAEGPTQKVVTWLKGEHLEALRAMADLRGTTTADLLRDYSKRGLISDLTKHIRAEEKPSKRPVPFVRLEKS
jgi:hypothetical protein